MQRFNRNQEIINVFTKEMAKLKEQRNIVSIPVSPKIKEQAFEFARKAYHQKLEENLYNEDPGKLLIRFAVGTLVELVIEHYYKLHFVNLTVGKTNDFNYPDLEPAGFLLGIKSAQFNKMPLVPVDPECAQLICIYDEENEQVLILGIADEETLNKYSCSGFVKSNNVDTEKYKTAFYGFSHLERFEGLESLKPWHIN